MYTALDKLFSKALLFFSLYFFFLRRGVVRLNELEKNNNLLERDENFFPHAVGKTLIVLNEHDDSGNGEKRIKHLLHSSKPKSMKRL